MECSIIELRQYTLHPGQRDVLIELFEREFLESQELAGMTLIGQFRAAHDGDRFVWLRGFADMESRAKALASFYDGPVWAAHRAAANSTMIDSDNVLLLRPAYPGSGFAVARGDPFPRGFEHSPDTTFVAGIRDVRGLTDRHLEDLKRAAAAAAEEAGGSLCAWFVSEQSPNNYPALPVREDANVLVGFASFSNAASADRYLAAMETGAVFSEAMKLHPTPRSRLR